MKRPPRTQADLTVARWGSYGSPVLLFPTAGGDAEEIERHKMIAHLEPLIAAGRAKVYSVDSVAGRALAEHRGSAEYQLALFNGFHEAIAREVIPAIHSDLGGQHIPVTVAGASIGAFNALAITCRYPELVQSAVCMSGTYAIEQFLGGHVNDDLYFSSPLRFLPGLEGPALDLLRTADDRARLGQRPLGGRRRVAGRRRPARAARASPTGSTTGAPPTTTTGRRGGRCCRSTSTTCSPEDPLASRASVPSFLRAAGAGR